MKQHLQNLFLIIIITLFFVSCKPTKCFFSFSKNQRIIIYKKELACDCNKCFTQGKLVDNFKKQIKIDTMFDLLFCPIVRTKYGSLFSYQSLMKPIDFGDNNIGFFFYNNKNQTSQYKDSIEINEAKNILKTLHLTNRQLKKSLLKIDKTMLIFNVRRKGLFF